LGIQLKRNLGGLMEGMGSAGKGWVDIGFEENVVRADSVTAHGANARGLGKILDGWIEEG